jgi:transcriptional regulator with XRE-family HTH domain
MLARLRCPVQAGLTTLRVIEEVGVADDNQDPPGPGAPSEADRDRGGLSEDLGAYIRSQREQAKLSLRKLASRAGVSNPYLSQIERGLRNPSAEILQAIARGLEISSETLYVQAGILDPDHEERTDVETAIARDRDLTESQRATLLEMYRSFRRLAALDNDGMATVIPLERDREGRRGDGGDGDPDPVVG